MTLQRLNPETIAVKTADSTMTIDSRGAIRIGEREISGPGEYDIAGMGLQTFAGCALALVENLNFLVVWQDGDQPDSVQESAADGIIWLSENNSGLDAAMKTQDPRVVVVIRPAVAEALEKQDAVTVVREASYKLTPQSLPAENRVYLLLA